MASLVLRRRLSLLCAVLLGAAVLSASSAAAAKPAAPESQAAPNCDPDGTAPKSQLRGLWIASVVNINWPAQPGLPAEQQRAGYIHLLDQAVSMRMNSVFVQVRPTADSFYNSPYEPWSQYLTGVQGQDPGYDVLGFLVSEAHKRNLEFHAWFNPYRVSMQADPNQLAPTHPARLHPDWVHAYGGKLYYDPGVPAVREFDEKVISDVVRKYDIDGVHFDDYFYPYPVGTADFPDDATYAQYGAGYANKADWRRDNVNRLVRELHDQIHALKPWVKFGISPFGIWRNASTDPLGSETNGLQAYDAIYADTRRWVKEGWVDYLAPQIYWNIGFPAAAYDKLVSWWSDVARGTGVPIYVGQAAYKIGAASPAGWLNPEEMPNHLVLNRQYPEIAGDIWYNIQSVIDNPLGFRDRLTSDFYKHPALVPVIDRLGGHAPPPTAQLPAKAGDSGVTLHWLKDAGKATYYAVYRFDGVVPRPGCGMADASHLVATVRGTRDLVNSWTDATGQPGTTYTYYVTALDRLHHESRPSNPVVTRTRAH
jgi:uncharacterized lipoprotein YddW (UPF0748 family)